jgi:hypothetical protein
MLCFNKYRYALENTYKISTTHLKHIYRDKPANVAELKAEFTTNMKSFIMAVKTSTFPVRTDYPYYVPVKIQEIIHKCLEPEVDKRYNNFYQIQADLNGFLFPDGVSDFYQDLITDTLHFTKEGKPCVIYITPNGANFEVKATKNSRNCVKFNTPDVSQAKLPKTLLKFASEL